MCSRRVREYVWELLGFLLATICVVYVLLLVAYLIVHKFHSVGLTSGLFQSRASKAVLCKPSPSLLSTILLRIRSNMFGALRMVSSLLNLTYSLMGTIPQRSDVESVPSPCPWMTSSCCWSISVDTGLSARFCPTCSTQAASHTHVYTHKKHKMNARAHKSTQVAFSLPQSFLEVLKSFLRAHSAFTMSCSVFRFFRWH